MNQKSRKLLEAGGRRDFLKKLKWVALIGLFALYALGANIGKSQKAHSKTNRREDAKGKSIITSKAKGSINV